MKKFLLLGVDAVSKKFDFNFRYILKNSFWIFSENLFSLFFGLLVVYAMANFLDPYIAGQYKYILSLAAIVSSLTIAGVTYAVTRETAMGHESFFHFATKKSLKWSSLPISIALIISFYYSFHQNFLFAVTFFLATLFTILTSNFYLYRSYLLGKEDFKHIAIYGNTALMLTTFFSVITFYYTDDLSLLIMGTLGIQCIFLFFIYLQVRRKIEYKDLKQTSINTFNEYVYSQSIINIISISAAHLDKIILFQFLGPVEVAVYTFVTVLPEKIRSILKSFANLTFPKFVKRDMSSIKDKMSKESLLFFGFLLFCFLIVFALIPFVYRWFLPKYVEYTYLAMIYSLSIFSVLALIPYNAIQAKHLKKQLYSYEIVNSFMQIFFVVVGVIYYGLLGAVIAKIVASLLGIFILYFLFYKESLLRTH